VGVKIRPEGGEIVVRGRTRDGTWEARVTAPAMDVNASAGTKRGAPATLFARESVNDLEADIAARGAEASRASEVADRERAIERLGLDFQIATRLTSWVAVTEEATVDPSAPTRRVRVPQNLPHGMSMEGLGLRAPGGVPTGMVGAAVAGGMAPMARAAAPMKAMVTRVASLGAPSQAFAPPPPPAQGAPQAPPAPPAPPAAASPRAPGPIARAVDAVRGFFTGASEGALSEESGAPPHLPARITTRKGSTVAIEVFAAFPLEWAPGTEVTLVWSDGTRTSAAVVGGTRAGQVQQGDTLRLVLRLGSTDEARTDEPVAIVTAVHAALGAPLVLALHETTLTLP
jgi:Ca-activated chloride channel family protein